MSAQALSTDPIIRDLEIMSKATRYLGWIDDQLRPSLGRRVIECGAGIGNFTERLLDRELVVAVDSYGPCLTYLARRFAGATHIIPVQLDISGAEFSSLARYQPDTIVCVNVLEHVQDDVTTLHRMRALLAGGGRLALLVPAFPCLYGSIDRVIGHYRRYGKQELKDKLTQAGFRITALFYMNAVAPVGWFLNNRVFKRTEESPMQVLVFDRWIVPWLRRAERLMKPPYGLSLIAIGETEARF